MRKRLLGILVLVPGLLAAQDCWSLRSDQTFQMNSQTWANTLPTTVKKWAKKKEDERAELVHELNSRIESGEVAPWASLTSNFEITGVSEAAGVQSLSLEATDGTYEYATTNYCFQDTMYLVRNSQVIWSVYQGDTLGLGVQGIQRIPTNLKIGDALPIYKDYSITLPETWDAQMSERVLAYSYSDKSVKTGYYTDSQTGESGFGQYEITERHNVYDVINHKVKITQQIKGMIVHYMGALVTEKETIRLGSIEYEAFVIESTSWSKNEVLRDYEAERAELAARKKANDEKLREKLMEKYFVKQGYVNEDGYSITYRKEWFVPGIGVVRTEQYDPMGVIQVRMTMSLN